MSAALAAVNARRATAHALDALRDEFAQVRAVRLVAAGKAAVGMAEAAQIALGSKITGTVVTTDLLSHPVPTASSEAAGRAALALAGTVAPESEVLLVCLSGGASSMLCVPAEGLTLADKRDANRWLLRAGLDIGAMNTVRRHLSAIKGGQLAARARRTITLAISDVITPVEDDPMTIGSGPTVGDATTFADALSIVECAGLTQDMPAGAMAHLRAGAKGDVSDGPVAPGDPRLRQSAYWVIASRRDAMRAAAETARQIGYTPHVRVEPLDGEARLAPDALFDMAATVSRPACIIASGETTVRVRGQGRGGRNQEFCVASLRRLYEIGSAALASVGTDGVDGPTDAAGGLVQSDAWTALGDEAARACDEALENNDAYPLLERLGGLIRSGPTGTNVGDLQVLLLG